MVVDQLASHLRRAADSRWHAVRVECKDVVQVHHDIIIVRYDNFIERCRGVNETDHFNIVAVIYRHREWPRGLGLACRIIASQREGVNLLLAAVSIEIVLTSVQALISSNGETLLTRRAHRHALALSILQCIVNHRRRHLCI